MVVVVVQIGGEGDGMLRDPVREIIQLPRIQAEKAF